MPTPTAPPSSVRTDTRVSESYEQYKADLRKRIEHDLLHIVKDVQIVRDTILNSQPTENGRERAHREYEDSMNNIRTLAQEEFTHLLQNEMSERKRALDVVDSNSLDVPRQQQWFLDNTCKADEERTLLVSPDASQNIGGILSTSPQHLADGERRSDGHSEGGYGSTVADGGPDESKGIGKAAEGKAESGEGDNNTRHSPSSAPTQSHHSEPPISRKNSLSSWRRLSTSKIVGDNDDANPQPPLRGSDPLASEPSGITLAFVLANEQVYSARSVLFPCRSSVNSTNFTQ
jgi:hypothetical protein